MILEIVSGGQLTAQFDEMMSSEDVWQVCLGDKDQLCCPSRDRCNWWLAGDQGNIEFFTAQPAVYARLSKRFLGQQTVFDHVVFLH